LLLAEFIEEELYGGKGPLSNSVGGYLLLISTLRNAADAAIEILSQGQTTI